MPNLTAVEYNHGRYICGIDVVYWYGITIFRSVTVAGQHTNRVILVTFEILLICRISPFGVMVGFTTQCPPMWVPPMADLQLDVNVFILAPSQYCKFQYPGFAWVSSLSPSWLLLCLTHPTTSYLIKFLVICDTASVPWLSLTLGLRHLKFPLTSQSTFPLGCTRW